MLALLSAMPRWCGYGVGQRESSIEVFCDELFESLLDVDIELKVIPAIFAAVWRVKQELK